MLKLIDFDGWDGTISPLGSLLSDSITWTNTDFAPHTATAEDGAWDTGTLERDGRARITFDAPGDYPYFCAHHPHMKGTVTVRTRSGA